MQEIKQLLKVLQAISSKNSYWSNTPKTKSLEIVFVEGIEQGTFTSDLEASTALYGTQPNDMRYKMLKYRVKKKLYNGLLTIDINNNNLSFQKEAECSRLLSMARLLLRQTEYNLALNLCSKAIAIAKEYEFNDILLSAYEIELTAFSNQVGAFKAFSERQVKYQKQLLLVNLEKEAISLHQSAKAQLKSTVKLKKKLLTELPASITRLKKVLALCESYECFFAYYRVSILYYELIGNFGEIINLTTDAVNKVDQNKVNPVRFDIRYNAFTLVYAHLRTKDYSKGLKHASEFYSLFHPASKNWFAYMENYFLLALHAKQYELALNLLHRVRNNSNFTILLRDAIERWQLYMAYLYFIDPTAPVFKDFNYQSFVNSITEYSKDKQGFNVAILVLQFMCFLKKGDTEGLLYRIESLKKYILTHLKDAFSLRSKLFLRLLMLTVTEDYDVELCRVKGAKYYQKLIQTPTPGDAYAEIEIVPYEHLWELILEEMPNIAAE